jgi:hypothetical protein
MPIEVKRPRSEGSDKSVVIGTVDWSPDGWDYKTKDSELAILFDEIKTEGVVVVMSSVEIDGETYDFAAEEVDVTDIRFISGLSTYLEQNSNMWIRIRA